MAPKRTQHGTPKRSKNEQQKNTKTTTKKRPPKRKKPDPAVNGKRCMQTLFFIQKRLGMYFSVLFY